MDDYLLRISQMPNRFSDGDLFRCLWNQYERVVMESLLTAFWLDFMIEDVHGGDVDTIHNVNQIGVDPLMTYKNADNADMYADRGSYSHKNVEGNDTNFQRIKHDARMAYDMDNSKTVVDAYEQKPLHFLGGSKNRPTDKNANLDHVVAAKTIHDDRGRVLSGLSTKDLADMECNLAWTNEHLNKSLGDTSKKAYVAQHPELSGETKTNMLNAEKEAKAQMGKEMFQAYYLDPSNPNCKQFYHDVTMAASRRGIELGIRQALGFVFVEVWIVTKQEVDALEPGCSLVNIIETVSKGIEKGFKSALSKYKEIIAKFGEGFLAGGLASLSTTLCNVFITTSKQVVKNIREISASVIRSSRVLLLNPDELEFGNRIKMSLVIMTTGASVLAGTAVGAMLIETPIGATPVVGDVVIRFCSTMVSGLLSCSFLVYMDRSEYINMVVDRMNAIPSEVTGMKELSQYLEIYSAELSRIDVEQFRKDTEQFQKSASSIINADGDRQLNSALKDLYGHFDLPWTGDFDSFMSEKDNHLVFE